MGDLSEAAASDETALLLEDCAFLAALRCLNASSLWCSVMRIDLFAGAISSARDGVLDLERVCCDGLSQSPSRAADLSLSESDVMAVDVDAIDRERREGCVVTGWATLELRPLCMAFSLLSAVPEARDPCAPSFFRRGRMKVCEI